MAYEYEIKIPMWLEDGRWLNMNVDDEVLEELEEVYRKAKAWDKILEMYKISNEHEDTKNMTMWQSPYEKYIEKLVKEYLEVKIND